MVYNREGRFGRALLFCKFSLLFGQNLGLIASFFQFASCHRPHNDLLVQVPAARRHTFKDEQTYDLYAHIPKIVRHLKKYQAYRQQVGDFCQRVA